MSENQNRDYAKFDSLTTEELEEILRLDASAPEGADSDTELLLYIMGVLANRRNANSTGKTAQEAWESFQQNYLGDESTEDVQEQHHPRITALWRRRLVAAAAILVLVIALPLTVKAFDWGEIIERVARWANETFSFASSEEETVTEPAVGDDLEYTSLQDMLKRNNRPYNMVPTWIPEGFALDKIENDIMPIQEIYRATYRNGDKVLKIQIQVYLEGDPGKVEVAEDLIEVYESCDVEYYIFSNFEQLRAIWIANSYECYISGDIPIDDLKKMIDSIEKE